MNAREKTMPSRSVRQFPCTCRSDIFLVRPFRARHVQSALGISCCMAVTKLARDLWTKSCHVRGRRYVGPLVGHVCMCVCVRCASLRLSVHLSVKLRLRPDSDVYDGRQQPTAALSVTPLSHSARPAAYMLLPISIFDFQLQQTPWSCPLTGM